jgi:hypothetical protein
VGGRGGVPSTGVSAVVLNLTVSSPTAGSYLTAWPTGLTRPTVSSLNFKLGETRANSATVALGSSGRVSIYNNSGAVRVIADVVGYYSSVDTTTVAGSDYLSQTPDRLADTRGSSEGQLAPHDALIIYTDFGSTGEKSSKVRALAVNITATRALGAGYLTAWDGGDTVPATSTLNFVKGATNPNLAVVKTSLCTDSNECDVNPYPPTRFGVYNGSSQPVDVIVDLVGLYFIDSGTPGLRYTPLPTPKRISDSRTSTNGTKLTGDHTEQLVAPSTVVGPDTDSLVGNLTAVAPSASTFLTLWAGGPTPGTSNLNAAAGATVANGAIIPLSSTNNFSIYNFAGSTDFLIDVTGHFDPHTVSGAAQRKVDPTSDLTTSGSRSSRLRSLSR